MAIERHDAGNGEAFHTTTDFLDCECGAVIPNATKLSEAGNDIVFCSECGTEFAQEDLADARVEEIIKGITEGKEAKERLNEKIGEVVALREKVRILREALERVQPHAENELARMEENECLPEDELVTETIRGDVAAGRAALEATKEGA